MTGRVSNGVIRTLFKKWKVAHPEVEAAVDFFDELREAPRVSRLDASLFSASRRGKSHTINKKYLSHRILPELRNEGVEDPDCYSETRAEKGKGGRADEGREDPA